MKLNVFDLAKNKVGEIDLPPQFYEEFRPDLIQRAVSAAQSHRRQNYGASPGAGKRVSAKLSRRRRDYKTSYGFGISRVPRKILSRRGTRMNWVGAFAPGTVGGRKAHPPKSGKELSKKINEKERAKALRSAIGATLLRELIIERGHAVPEGFPFVLQDELESLDKTGNVLDSLERLGFADELSRAEERSVRAGKGKNRGRKYKKKKGILIVVAKEGKISKAAANLPGIDVAEVKKLSAELLAPGGKPGRLTLWTTAALDMLEKEKLFT